MLSAVAGTILLALFVVASFRFRQPGRFGEIAWQGAMLASVYTVALHGPGWLADAFAATGLLFVAVSVLRHVLDRNNPDRIRHMKHDLVAGVAVILWIAVVVGLALIGAPAGATVAIVLIGIVLTVALSALWLATGTTGQRDVLPARGASIRSRLRRVR